MKKQPKAPPNASSTRKRFGFMAGKTKVPVDFNRIGTRKIQRLFEGKK